MKFHRLLKRKKISDVQRASDVINSLTPEQKQEVLKYMSEEERRQFSSYEKTENKELKDHDKGSDDDKQCSAQDEYSSEKNVDKSLEKVLEHADNEKLFQFIRNMHPQTAAFLMSYISKQKAADIMIKFSKDTQKDILRRMDSISDVSQDVRKIIYDYTKKELI